MRNARGSGFLLFFAFVQRIEPGTSVAIYTCLPDDKTTYRNEDQGTFTLREQHCGPGSVQHTTHILHKPGHYDYLEPISEEKTWTSPRPKVRRAAQRKQRERHARPKLTPSPPLIPASDDDPEVDGEGATRQ